MKKVLSVLGLVLAMSVNAFAGNINVYVNNSKVNFSQAPLVEKGVTLVPVRALLESLGAKVYWNSDEKTVKADLGAESIKMVIGSKTAYVNERIVPLTVAPEIVGGTTMIPLRFVSENLGLSVNWNSETKTIKITDNTYKGFSPVPDFGKINNISTLEGSGHITISGESRIVDYTYDKSKVTDKMLKDYVNLLEKKGFKPLNSSSLYYSGEKNSKLVVSIDTESNIVITLNVL